MRILLETNGTGVLSTGERLYVALASGLMRELCPDDSIAYAVSRVGPELRADMENVLRSDSQPQVEIQHLKKQAQEAVSYRWMRAQPKFLDAFMASTRLVTTDLREADLVIDSVIAAEGTPLSVTKLEGRWPLAADLISEIDPWSKPVDADRRNFKRSSH